MQFFWKYTPGFSPMLSALDALRIHLNNLESVVFFTPCDEVMKIISI